MKCRNFSCVFAAVPMQFRITLLISLLPTALLLAGIPMIASIQNLYQEEAAILLDRIFSLTGILLLTPLTQPEQDTSIWEAVAVKRIWFMQILVLRVLCMVVLLPVLALILCSAMRILGCQLPLGHYTAAASATAFFLGSLGFAASLLSSNWVIGYLAPVLYYFLNYGLGNKLRYFNMFSLATEGFHNKIVLGVTGIFVLVLAFAIKAVYYRRPGII